MARTYTSTIDLKTWKEHTCAHCGGLYRYLLQRRVTGSAANAERASENARRNVRRTLECDVDIHPCPTCGLVQPDMIGQQRARRHQLIFWLAFGVFIVLVILRLADAFRADQITVVATIVGLVAAAAHAISDRNNLNADLTRNRHLAAERVSAGVLRHTPGRLTTAGGQQIHPPGSITPILALPMLGLAVLLVASPEIIRAASHWPINGDCYPPVVGPGDQTRVYMDQRITSIKGYWSGSPVVTLRLPGQGILSVPATTNSREWGSSISAKASEKNSTSTPWIQMTVPAEAGLAGKAGECQLELAVTYPHASGSSTFERAQAHMSRTVPITLAPMGAGSQYNRYWWQGTAIGILMLLAAGQMMRVAARALQRSALPTRVFAPDAAKAG